ncbi:hypothetical protein ACIB24_05430 [Spongisporangium articulatum]|uniref:Lipoprotein n=1 Tax=Spongisporangium articulatum TaxID=3362603 RepID=A0ABW8AJF5_9ACTN
MRQINVSRRRGTGLGGAALAVSMLLGVSACGSDTPAQTPAQAVEHDYQSYASAVSNKNGETAATWVNAKTLTYFDGLRDKALDDDEKTLRKATPIDQLTVLSLRKNVPAEVLRTGTPQAIVASGVKNGAIGDGSLPQTGLSDVKVNGTQATAQLKLGLEDSTQTMTIRFDREANRWKFDISATVPAGNATLEQIEKSNKVTAKAVVDQVLVSRYGAKEAKAIWTPIGRS